MLLIGSVACYLSNNKDVYNMSMKQYFLTEQDTQDPKSWYLRLRSDFLKAIIAPFCICSKHLVECFLWLMFTIIAGQLGTIINVVQRWVFGDWEFLPAFCPDSASGSFYTFALVMIASLIGPIFIRFVNKDKPEYRPITFVYVTILIFSLLFCGLYYSFATQNPVMPDFSQMHNDQISVDLKQLVFFVLAILFSWYSFGLSLMPKHESEACLDKDYQKENDKERNELSGQVTKLGASNKPNGDNNNSNTEDFAV